MNITQQGSRFTIDGFGLHIVTVPASTNSMSNLPFAGTLVFDVTPGPFTLNLVCTASNTVGVTTSSIRTAQLTALFVPS